MDESCLSRSAAVSDTVCANQSFPTPKSARSFIISIYNCPDPFVDSDDIYTHVCGPDCDLQAHATGRQPSRGLTSRHWTLEIAAHVLEGHPGTSLLSYDHIDATWGTRGGSALLFVRGELSSLSLAAAGL